MTPFATARRGGPTYRSRTTNPMKAYRNRMSWARGCRVPWSDMRSMMNARPSFGGVSMSWRDAYCGPKSVWTNHPPVSRPRRRGRWVCRWWYNGTLPAGAD